MTVASDVFDVQAERLPAVRRLPRKWLAVAVGIVTEGAFEMSIEKVALRVICRRDGRAIFDGLVPADEAHGLRRDSARLPAHEFVERLRDVLQLSDPGCS